MAQNVRGFIKVGKLTNCPPGTKTKFITKSRSLELLPNRITSAEYEAGYALPMIAATLSPNCTILFSRQPFCVRLEF